MLWVRAGIAAIGVLMTAIGVSAWLIDREGTEQRKLYRFDAPTVLVVLGARVEPDGSPSEALETRVRPLLDQQVREGIEPFLGAMRRRLERDRKRVHAYHDDLRSAAVKRLAASARAEGDRADAERRRDTLRVEAIEREYRAKLDDLRHNYALRVTVEWVQTLELYVPVQRLDVLIRRRKGERVVQLDWHPLVKVAEPPLCEAGFGRDRLRLVCDEKLHLTEPAGQAACPSCGKPFCRACFPAVCPHCRRALGAGHVHSQRLTSEERDLHAAT